MQFGLGPTFSLSGTSISAPSKIGLSTKPEIKATQFIQGFYPSFKLGSIKVGGLFEYTVPFDKDNDQSFWHRVTLKIPVGTFTTGIQSEGTITSNKVSISLGPVLGFNLAEEINTNLFLGYATTDKAPVRVIRLKFIGTF